MGESVRLILGMDDSLDDSCNFPQDLTFSRERVAGRVEQTEQTDAPPSV
jgi:hypothetical protein